MSKDGGIEKNSTDFGIEYRKVLNYIPKLIYNNDKEGKKVINHIERELNSCEEFIICVAFITNSGLQPLKLTLKELEKNNIPGKIITTDYLTFSEPSALDFISEFKNIELKMYRSKESQLGFHTKGYIFRRGENYSVMIGSSNLTAKALSENHEWNTRIESKENAEYVEGVLEQFYNIWNSIHAVDYSEIKESYKNEYNLRKRLIESSIPHDNSVEESVVDTLKPNSMQQQFIDELKNIIEKGKDKALLISATGTGKTFASAFAVRELGFKKVLFLAHRKEIVDQAKTSYEKVFGNEIEAGLLTGEEKDQDKDFVFALIQTLSQEKVLKELDPKKWDLIIIDEAHHSTADTYKLILDYFKPRLWLGMTATPDKRTKNESVYDLFDHNIAHEIRLQDALEQNLLCPFHYFGITDIEIDDKKLDSNKKFAKLTSKERVKHIMNEARYYGFSGDRVKGLIFCSSIKEATELSKKFNRKKWRTVVLSGKDSRKTREDAIYRLVMEDGNDPNALDYIITVDVFSEGVDVPEINQIIMLRPTESPIVFTQQLGRGLRKSKDKEYVVILDFIGNYNSNYMIPIALSGDRSYNKENARQFIYNGGACIPGISTIHFDEISRQKIYSSIDSVKFSSKNMIKKNYKNLKYKLGRIPTIFDFEIHGDMDVFLIIQEYGSYHNFLVEEEVDYKIKLNKVQKEMIEFISREIANGKRIHELIVLENALSGKKDVIKSLRNKLKSKYNKVLDDACKINLINYLTNNFFDDNNAKKYIHSVFIQKNDKHYQTSKSFSKELKNGAFKQMVSDLVEFGKSRYESEYCNNYLDTNLVIGQKYSIKDVTRLLNWEKYLNGGCIGGYKLDKKTKTMPVFINYDKHEDDDEILKYEDRFIDRKNIITISKKNRTINGNEEDTLLNSEDYGVDVHLFVRKNKNDKPKEFYYLGKMKNSGIANEITVKNTKNKDVNVVEMHFELDVPVREDLFKYIVEE